MNGDMNTNGVLYRAVHGTSEDDAPENWVYAIMERIMEREWWTWMVPVTVDADGNPQDL